MSNLKLAIIADNHAALKAFEEEGRGELQRCINFLKFTKQSEWVWGGEENEIEDTAELAANMPSYSKGFIVYDEGTPIDEVMEPIASGRQVNKSDLDDHGTAEGDENGWKAQTSIELKLLSDGTELRYSTTSRGGRIALSNLARNFASRVRQGEKDLVPIVQLSGDSYKHKKYGTVVTPVIEIIKWANEETLMNVDFDAANDDSPIPDGTDEGEAPAADSKTRKRSKATAGNGQGQRKLSS